MVIKSPISRWHTHHTLILLVVLLGLVVRFHGLVWTLPYHFNGDETRIISNGITVQQEGVQAYTADVTSMTNYPPLRGWEIALTRSILLLFWDVPNGVQVLYGRMFSLFYALLTIILIYQLGKTVTRNPYVGIVAALLFSVWTQTIEIGQRVLSDGSGMMFFTLCAWLSVVAYQKVSYKFLVLAIVAGILAGLGKYNFFPVLLMPGLVGLTLLAKYPRQLLVYGAVPSLILAVPILYLATRTVSSDDLYYNYLNDKAQLENELRYWQLRGYTPDDSEWQAVYNRYPLTTAMRLARNYDILLGFLPPYTLAMTLLGILGAYWMRRDGLDQWGLAMLGITSLALLVAFSLFRLVEGRHLYGSMVIALVFWGVGVVFLGRYSKLGAILVLGILTVPMGIEAWTQNDEFTKPDTRVATVDWLINNARNGTGIAIENEPYEFWTQNGYPSAKQFNVVRTYRLWDKEPQVWENEGFYYLVADRTYEWRGGYYAGHEKEDLWNPYVEEVARFEGEAYAGPDRIILRVFRPEVKVDVDFGGVVNFYGYNAEPQTLQPGDTLTVKYFWKAIHANGVDYIIFNHLIHAETGEPLVTLDRLAGHNGTKLSSQWDEHEWLFDHFELTIPDDALPGQYTLQMGLYSAIDGTRLPVEGGEDGILPLLEVTVESKSE
jgi:hypothetical protein